MLSELGGSDVKGGDGEVGPFALVKGSLPVGGPSTDADSPEAEAKRRCDIQVQTVPDHDGILGTTIECLQSPAEHALIGLGYADFA